MAWSGAAWLDVSQSPQRILEPPSAWAYYKIDKRSIWVHVHELKIEIISTIQLENSRNHRCRKWWTVIKERATNKP